MDVITGQNPFSLYQNKHSAAFNAPVERTPIFRRQSPVHQQTGSPVTDTVDISSEARDKIGDTEQTPDGLNTKNNATRVQQTDNPDDLNQSDQKILTELKQRDAEVRAHEQAHLAAAGQYAKGAASFTYQKGPDGNSYAIGGEVGIDVSKASTPEETIEKMQTIKRAAMAPATPSAADRQIASQAASKEAAARQELAIERREELHQENEDSVDSEQGEQVSEKTETSSEAPSYSSLKAVEAYTKMADQL